MQFQDSPMCPKPYLLYFLLITSKSVQYRRRSEQYSKVIYTTVLGNVKILGLGQCHKDTEMLWRNINYLLVFCFCFCFFSQTET